MNSKRYLFLPAKIIAVMAIALLVVCCNSSSKEVVQTKPRTDPLKNVVIHCFEKSKYCGGARPSEEMLQELESPVILKEQLCFIRKGSVNLTKNTPVTSGTSDMQGDVRFALAPGKYCLVLPNKVDSAAYKMYLLKHSENTERYSAIDKNCLDRWFEKPELTFTVTNADSVVHFDLIIQRLCSWDIIPCAEYRGPFPP